MRIAFGRYPKLFPPFSEPLGFKFFNAYIATQSLWLIGITLFLGVALWYFFSRQLYGRAMRATSQNQIAARLVGINTKSMIALSFAISAAIGAIGGIVVAPLTYVVYNGGWLHTMRGILAAVIGGGLSSYMGAFVGGFTIGILEALTVGYVTSLFKDAVLFAVLLAILVWRPAGILGKKNAL
jgi:branched-chain amino acid transport system permease protein